ncbi:MAG: Asp23/Gls24 family envelope stress response protein [Verrucomicrobiota bacterium]|nr:Asp23/Gls24 family envelope stress response protein [Verrucomicrobiota bacterium]
MYDQLKNMDTRELDLPETVFIRDIDTRVFQTIALKCLAKIEGIGLIEGNLFDSLLGREVERVKGIHVEQDQKNHSVELKVEINVQYGVHIPTKAEEIQEKLVEEISQWTGLHVSFVHVIFKDLMADAPEPNEPNEAEGNF